MLLLSRKDAHMKTYLRMPSLTPRMHRRFVDLGITYYMTVQHEFCFFACV